MDNAYNFFTGLVIIVGMMAVLLELVVMCFMESLRERNLEMLVLKRKSNQSILIGKDIKVVILGVENGVVKIGVEAPINVNIVREELLEEIKNVNSR